LDATTSLKKTPDRALSRLLCRRLSVAIEHRNVDSPVEVTFLESNPVGFVKEIGVEDDGPVGPIRNGYRVRPGPRKKIPDRRA